MNMEHSSKDYLRIYDSLSIDKKPSRRIASRALFDYYNEIISEMGVECLGIKKSTVHNSSFSNIWNICRTRLQSLLDTDVKSKYGRVINKLSDCRNSVAHNTDYNPEKALLGRARNMAEEWKSWFDKAALSYKRQAEQEGVKDAAIRMIRESILQWGNPENLIQYNLDGEEEEMEKEANDILDRLEKIEEKSSGVSKELIYLLSDARSLEYRFSRLRERTEEKYYRMIEKERERERKERMRQLEKWSKLRGGHVTREYDGETPYVGITSNTIDGNSETYTVNLEHSLTKSEAAKRLRHLNEGEEVEVLVCLDTELDEHFVTSINER